MERLNVSALLSRFYEKVIKVKADVAASPFFTSGNLPGAWRAVKGVPVWARSS
jgi:truncated hemoglobin YjbI